MDNHILDAVVEYRQAAGRMWSSKFTQTRSRVLACLATDHTAKKSQRRVLQPFMLYSHAV